MKQESINHLKIGMIQESFSKDKEKNIEKIARHVKDLASKGVELVLLSELHTTPYFCQTENVDYFDLAESIPGPTTKKLSDIAAKSQVVIVSSIFEKRDPGIYHNTAVVFEKNGEIAGIY